MTAEVQPVARPPFDAELRAGLTVVGGMFPPTITPDLIDFMRTSYAAPPIDDLLLAKGIVCTDDVVVAPETGMRSPCRCCVPRMRLVSARAWCMRTRAG